MSAEVPVTPGASMCGWNLKRRFKNKVIKNKMKKNIQTTIFAIAATMCAITFTACKKKKGDDKIAATTYYMQQDQFGRPAINTVFVDASEKDAFNTTTPVTMGGSFQSKFQTKLLALNSGYTTNALGQNAATLTGLLATDVLGVSLTKKTTFFDGTNVLTGRTLGDDVINVELLLIFGGPAGSSNPGLTNDHVDANDKAFLSSFPYLAAPF